MGKKKKEMPYASSVCFSLENVSVTFELSSEKKNKLEFKLKKKDFLSSTSAWGKKIRSIFQGTNIVEKWHRRM